MVLLAARTGMNEALVSDIRKLNGAVQWRDDDVDYLRSDAKYTLVAWRGANDEPGEALVRTPLKELVAQLDPAQFAQVHRSIVVSLRAISHVTREDETAAVHLKGRKEVLPVSRTYLHRFRQM